MIHTTPPSRPRPAAHCHAWQLGFACWLAALAAGAAVKPCRAPIALPPLAREELAAVPLVSQVFAVSRDDEADLAVLDKAGQQVPFVLETLVANEQTTIRRDSPMSTPQARELTSQELELTYVLPTNGVSPVGLTVDTPLRDFRQRVKVEGSTDGSAWQVLVDGAVLVDLSRFVDVRACDVAWAPNACRRFRVTFFDATRDRPDDVREVTSGTAGTNVRQNVRAEPFRVRAVRFWHHETVLSGRLPVRTTYPLLRDDAASQTNKGVFVFRSNREPLNRLTLATTSRLFQRVYQLYGRNGPEDATPEAPGQLLASGLLTQIRFQDLVRSEMTIDFPVSRHREYVLVCEASTGEAADLTVSRAEGIIRRVIFAATPGREYVLTFGDPAASRPPLPEAAALQTLLASGCHPIAATLGTPVGAGAPAHTWRAWLNSSGVMIGAIIVAGLLLAAMLVHAGRKLT